MFPGDVGRMNEFLPKSWIILGRTTLRDPLNDLESGNSVGEKASGSAEAPALFFSGANNVLRDAESVRASIRNIEADFTCSNDSQGGPVLAVRRENSEELSLVATRAQTIKKNLADIQRDRLTILKSPGGRNEAADLQRHNVHSHLLQKMREIEEDIQAVRATVDSGNLKAVERRLFTLTGQELSPEEVQSFNQNNQSEQMIRRALMHQRGSGGRDIIINTMAELYERRKEVEDLSAALMQLHAVFRDLSVTVENDVHVLDKIEDEVLGGLYEKQGTVPFLQTALRLQWRSHTWWLLLILFISLVVLGGVVSFLFLTRGSS